MSDVCSISDLNKQIDFYSIEDWRSFFKNSKKTQASELTKAKSPVGSILGGTKAEAIWGIDKSTLSPKFFFFGGRASNTKVPKAKRTVDQKWYYYCSWFACLAPNAPSKPKLDNVREALSSAQEKSQIDPQVWKILSSSLKSFVGEWYEFDQMYVFLLFRKAPNNSKLSVKREREELVCRYYDLHAVKQSINLNIPRRSLINNQMDNLDKLTKLFVDPKQFNPLDTEQKHSHFLWPWQRCIATVDSCDLILQPIQTISLVSDLRFSTVAMQLFVSEGGFAAFVDKVMASSKKIILNNGGYFDNETGDGVVAHFCEANNYEKPSVSRLIRSSLKAAQEIRKTSKKLCEEAQADLGQGLGALQMSVGIHLDNAVWSSSENRIRAYGPSVVWASRLCSAAKPLEILISNAVYQTFVREKQMKEVARFRRKNVEFKEYKKESELFCYSDQLLIKD